jgi:hypothetical protein
MVSAETAWARGRVVTPWSVATSWPSPAEIIFFGPAYSLSWTLNLPDTFRRGLGRGF